MCIQDISTEPRDRYGDGEYQQCIFNFKIKVDSPPNFKYNNTKITSSGTNASMKTIYNDEYAIILLTLTFNTNANGVAITTYEVVSIDDSSNESSQFISFNTTCEEPPPPIIIPGQFTFNSINRNSIMTTFKIFNWNKSNLPKLNKVFYLSNGIVSNQISAIAGLNSYRLVLVIDENFDLSSNKIDLAFELESWPITSNYFSFKGPISSKLPFQYAVKTQNFYPSNSLVYGIDKDNLMYNLIELESNYPIDYFFIKNLSSATGEPLTSHSIILSDSLEVNKYKSSWLIAYTQYSNPTTLSTFLWNGINFSQLTPNTNSTEIVQLSFITDDATIIFNGRPPSISTYVAIIEFLSNTNIKTDLMSVPIEYHASLDYSTILYSYKSDIAFPYGVTSDTSNINFKFTVLASNSVKKFDAVLLGSETMGYNEPGDVKFDSTPPIFKRFSITPLNDGNFLIKAEISESGGSGFFCVKINDLTVLSLQDYESGNVYNNSTYSRVFKFPVGSIEYGSKIKAFDQAGNNVEMEFYKYGYNDDKEIIIPESDNSPIGNDKWLISSFFFKESQVDLTNSGMWNTAFLNFTNIDPDQLILYHPYLILTPYKLGRNIHFYKPIPFYWDYESKICQADFYLPSGIPSGNIDFKISFPLSNNFYESTFINNLTQSELKSIGTSSNASPLLVDQITSTPQVNIFSYQSPGNGSWEITLDGNDLEIGYISIATRSNNINDNYTKRYFNKTITELNLVAGSNHKYLITIPLNCLTTSYEIVNLTLIDKQGYISEFVKYSSIYSNSNQQDCSSVPVNPFLKYYNSNEILPQIETTCVVVTAPPISIPKLIELKTTYNSGDGFIDVGIEPLSLVFVSFTVQDSNGIDIDQLPFIYLIGGIYGNNLLSFPTVIKERNSTFVTFTSNLNIPRGFGYPYPIMIEIFGVMNKLSGVTGWSYYDMEKMKQVDPTLVINNLIHITFTSYLPHIQSSSPYFSNQNKLTIYGLNFGLNSSASILNQNGIVLSEFSIIPKDVKKNIMILSFENNLIPNNDFYIQINDKNLSVLSNSYFIKLINNNIPINPTPTPTQSNTPTILPTNSPQACIGNPVCGGPNQGICNEGIGCTCFSPYTGLGCQSKIIIIKPPSINPNEPSTNLTIPGTDGNESSSSSLVAIISIIALRELDFNNKVLKTHKFDQWKLTKLSENENQYITNISVSNDQIENQITTISVTTQWFENKTIIEFADQSIEMESSSLKYNINITSYAFTSNLNSLELVISAIASNPKYDTDDNTCSDSKFGDTTSIENSNYIQLSVNDHSLFGKFIKRGIVDNKFTVIQNKKLNNDDELQIQKDTYYTSSSYIAIQIPNYNDLIQLDPNFSLLIDSENANSICKSNNSSNGISKGTIIGVVIGCVGGAIIIAVLILVLVKYKYNLKIMKMKVIKLKRKN